MQSLEFLPGRRFETNGDSGIIEGTGLFIPTGPGISLYYLCKDTTVNHLRGVTSSWKDSTIAFLGVIGEREKQAR